MCSAKSRASTIRAAIIAGMSIRWMARRILPTDIRCSACRWRWNTARPNASKRDRRSCLRSHARRVFQRRAGKGRAAQRQGDPGFEGAQLKECLVATGFPSHKRHKNPNIYFYHQITLRTHGVRRAGSAALDLCNVACGRFDGFWEFNLNPWDTAAGALIVEEAGGKVSRFDGSPFRTRQPRDAGVERPGARSAGAGVPRNFCRTRAGTAARPACVRALTPMSASL